MRVPRHVMHGIYMVWCPTSCVHADGNAAAAGADNSSLEASRAIPAVTSPGETDRPRQLGNTGAPSRERAHPLPAAEDAASPRAGPIPARAMPSPEDGSMPAAGLSLEEDPGNRSSRPPLRGRTRSKGARRKLQNR
ncbi:hypothetical protein HPB48_011297 [Haemaphysalis longicornis]|uniref:Uncharacterized protein n=1 Tax=Haemaphysalis longicornis TaxID=44386 RepID=A0A9J6GKD7_HAELO|nr:hypothetical protein HPB48_011297 [Haemaphysalis longicornis]